MSRRRRPSFIHALATAGVTLAALAALAGPAAAQVVLTPTAAQCSSADYLRTPAGQGWAKAADASPNTSVCRAACDAVRFDPASCNSEAFFATICGHIEAARINQHVVGARCLATISQNMPQRAPRVALTPTLVPTLVARPDVAPTVVAGGTANTVRRPYTRPSRTLQSLDGSWAGRMAGVASRLAAPGGTSTTLLAHQRYDQEAGAGRFEVESCDEYAWARMPVFSRLQDEMARRGADARTRANLLYELDAAQAPKPYALGAMAIADANATMRTSSQTQTVGPDGQHIRLGSLMGGRRAKNDFVAVPVRGDVAPPVTTSTGYLPTVLDVPPSLLQAAPARATVAVDRITLTDPLLAQSMALAAATTYEDTWEANRLWLQNTAGHPDDDQRREAIQALAAELASTLHRRAQHVAAMDEAARTAVEAYRANIADINQALNQPVTVDIPIFDPGTVMYDPFAGVIQAIRTLSANPTIGFHPLTVAPNGVFRAYSEGAGELDSMELEIARMAVQPYIPGLVRFDAAVEAQLAAARARQCFSSPGYGNLCDWNAAAFLERATRRLQVDQEVEYGRCLDTLGSAPFLGAVAGGALVATDAKLADHNAHGFTYSVMQANGTTSTVTSAVTEASGASFQCGARLGLGYARDVAGVRQYMLCGVQQQADARREAERVAAAGREAIETLHATTLNYDPETGHVEPFSSVSFTLDDGNDLFGTLVEIDNAWEIPSIEDDTTVCTLSYAGFSYFHADGRALGSKLDLMSGQTDVQMGGDMGKTIDLSATSFTYFGQELTQNAIQMIEADVYSTVAEALGTGSNQLGAVSVSLPIDWVPVTVSGGITAQGGVDYSIGDLPPDVDEGNCEVSASLILSAKAQPWLRADAFLSAAVNVYVAEAGVAGQLSLVDLSVGLENRLVVKNGDVSVTVEAIPHLRALSGALSAFVHVDAFFEDFTWTLPLFQMAGIEVNSLPVTLQQMPPVSLTGLKAARDL